MPPVNDQGSETRGQLSVIGDQLSVKGEKLSVTSNPEPEYIP